MIGSIAKKIFHRPTVQSIRVITAPYYYNPNPLTVLLDFLPDAVRLHAGHVSVVAQILAKQARDMGEDFPHLVLLGGLYHHLGECPGFPRIKKQIPVMSEQALNKNMDALRAQAGSGADVVLDIARHHCERMDGSGYPDRLRGEQISLAARLVGLADTLDSLLCGNLTSPNGSTDRAERFISKSGIDLFGTDAITCFENERDMIYKLYLDYYQRMRGWA